jgi:hypothetical protein
MPILKFIDSTTLHHTSMNKERHTKQYFLKSSYRSHPVVLYNMIKQFIQSNTTHISSLINSWQHVSVLVNQLQASTYYTDMVHSVSAHIMGSRVVYKPDFTNHFLF